MSSAGLKRVRGLILAGSLFAFAACQRGMPETEYRTLASKLCARLTQKQDALTARIKAHKHYDWNQDIGQLVFTSRDLLSPEYVTMSRAGPRW